MFFFKILKKYILNYLKNRNENKNVKFPTQWKDMLDNLKCYHYLLMGEQIGNWTADKDKQLEFAKVIQQLAGCGVIDLSNFNIGDTTLDTLIPLALPSFKVTDLPEVVLSEDIMKDEELELKLPGTPEIVFSPTELPS